MAIVYKRVVFLFLVLFTLNTVSGQPALRETELKLQALQKEISRNRTDLQNMAFNDSLCTIFSRILQEKGSFDYPFDSLNFMGKILSDDKKVRFFTWNLPLSNGSNQYFGFILYRNDGTHQVFSLTDKSVTVSNPENDILSAENWYGCLVYAIIDTRFADETGYTLIGYDPDNIFTSKKLIDILTFSNGVPVFGKPVFKLKNKTVSRMLFEYSSRVQMTLKWHDKLKMIVFDHLAPASPVYMGNYRYYGPDFSYDGLKLEKGFWEYKEDPDVRDR